jgi:NAD(P)-dependent dehydrogenase (short-subunit alcohol dehydrogenase family)
MAALRDELLRGRSIQVVGDADATIAAALRSLGATVNGDGVPRALVYDARPGFAAGGADALRAALDEAWRAISDVASAALIPGEDPAKIVLIGPAPAAGELAEAARAALENLVRTLSVEWARYSITTVMVAPGATTTEGELCELVCFLVSPGGEYLSGCRLELGSVGQ